ncbi:hypothetical protein L228DRAFT_16732 [Xylona heveae TC161]|uniref:Cytoplasmic tRNA 2-thiolation protein 2 n=1 Tax=Xylona heveae (strain CBS 132557 / TC161) TaxID=1328760 RepID=A0A165JV82_XYLHT|nr:hypothetical protein L228DRAFT_16732 [Xylona heveae TC161]KZF26674.1 hypothetical protein L228DRAFT_16732 [Xylona heveae TC161]
MTTDSQNAERTMGAAPVRLCKRCQEIEATTIMRTEPLCSNCFVEYIKKKVAKQLEAYRIKNASKNNRRRVLLPISFGVSSLSLLHVLDGHLQSQIRRTNRTGYELHVLHVNTSGVDADAPQIGRLEVLKEKYPRHTYSELTLEDVFDHANEYLETTLRDVNINIGDVAPPSSKHEKLVGLLSALPSPTSRADVVETLRNNLIIAFAKENDCQSITWGDSATRLAEKTISETAKGRGFSLPWQISGGESPYGLHVSHPLRDVLKKELVIFAENVDPPLTPLIHSRPAPTMTSAPAKSTTIDDLMGQYFASIEESFPSIVANVVRTTSKLRAPEVTEGQSRCDLCGLPLADSDASLGEGESSAQSLVQPEGNLCYGCARTTLGSRFTPHS